MTQDSEQSLRFHEVESIRRDEALAAFDSNDAKQICNALISITFHDPDWRWVQEQCMRLAKFPNVEVRGLVATCFGHIARIHGQLDIEPVSSTLKLLADDPEVAHRVDDAVDDIRMFMKIDLSNRVI